MKKQDFSHLGSAGFTESALRPKVVCDFRASEKVRARTTHKMETAGL